MSNTQTEASTSKDDNDPVIVTTAKISKKNRRKPNTVNPSNEMTENEHKNKPT